MIRVTKDRKLRAIMIMQQIILYILSLIYISYTVISVFVCILFTIFFFSFSLIISLFFFFLFFFFIYFFLFFFLLLFFLFFFFFFFNNPAPPEISPLPLHDPFPISPAGGRRSPPASLPSRAPPSRCRSPARTDRCGETSRSAGPSGGSPRRAAAPPRPAGTPTPPCRRLPGSSRAGGSRTATRPTRAPVPRSEEHTSELQSQSNLVCRLLLA